MSLDRPNPPLYLVRTFFVLFVALSARVLVEYSAMKVNQIRWMVVFAIPAVNALGAPILTVETDNPTNNMFAIGTSAAATFSANEWTANEERQIVADVFDYRNEKVATLTASLKAGENGTGSVRVALPTDRHGFFRVRAKAGDLALPKMGTRPAGEFTYGVTIDPKDRPDIPQERAFAGIHGAVAGCDAARWLGAHQILLSPNYTKADFKQACARQGVAPWKTWGFANVSMNPGVADLPMWRYRDQNIFTPSAVEWMKANRKDMKWLCYKTEEGRAVFREWIALVADSLRNRPTTPGKRLYQIFWEPDLSVPNKRELVEAARIACATIREVDPEGLVTLPTLSNCSLVGWHRELFELGILKFGDVFDLHPYTAYPPEPNGYLENIRALKRLLAEYGRPDMPFICTESGYQTSATPKGERMQLDGQVRVQLILLGEGVWFNCPFYPYDYGGDGNDHSEGDYGLAYNLEYPKTRFGPKSISPRPAFCGLAAFSMLLDGFRPRESVECLGETVLGYVYTNQTGRATAALWDFGATDRTVRLPVGKAEIELADIMGNRFARKTTDGVLELKLSTSPVYVFDPELSAWDKGLELLRESAAAAERAKAASPVKVLSAEPAFSDGAPSVAVSVRNDSDGKSGFAVSTRIVGEPDARRTVHATLAPRETRIVSVPLPSFRPDPFRTFALEVTAENASGCRAELTRSVNFLQADSASGVGTEIAVGDWKGARRHPVPQIPVVCGAAKDVSVLAPDDMSAEIGFGWNERYLLIDAVVNDDAYRHERTGWWSWCGDAIQFGFAKKRLDKLTGNDYTDTLEQGTTEITFALTKNGPEAYRTISCDPYRWPTDAHGLGQIDLGECRLSIVRDDAPDGRVTLRYRIALPWRYLNKTTPARAGESFFVSTLFNDLDPGDVTYSSLGVFELKRLAPRHFGSVYLAE